ncbi:unnamed protein product [Protopolystoma xenopodis]|uniref:Uncharacterized protein n=1 Tax=Protopolystoma xenopodis TaxID=117903 RepID=A0A3S5FD31_9PLAT|nr:unnamed protein product [Protopolystoma xenopodis]
MHFKADSGWSFGQLHQQKTDGPHLTLLGQAATFEVDANSTCNSLPITSSSPRPVTSVANNVSLPPPDSTYLAEFKSSGMEPGLETSASIISMTTNLSDHAFTPKPPVDTNVSVSG